MNIEVHPHTPFVPAGPRFLIVGSFPGKNNVQPTGDEWFYSAPRNQFWKILSAVFCRDLTTTRQKKQICTEQGIAMTDIFLKVKRKRNTNSDNDLEVVEYNIVALEKILSEQCFEKIFFTSKFVEKEFKKLFPKIKQGESLPSPSPRFARMSFNEKVERYRKALQ